MSALNSIALEAMGGKMHTAGIYSDMTVDGPEIGTLVVIVDRAKNLPNRKTMGKQDPYCAARLGKEAKKTDTDRRGGQTPKWDQELRFTVHDSPDYNNLKVSVFNDDKKTDMIGEMWVNLEQVVVRGGGKMDTWHTLNYKGKYAGEVMLELTYYDSRPDERDGKRRDISMNQEKKIKRRPLATDMHTTPLPHQMENTRTAGPRAMGSRSRAQSSVAGAYGPAVYTDPNAPPSIISPSGMYSSYSSAPPSVASAPAIYPSQSAAPPVQYPHHQQLPQMQEDAEFHPGFESQNSDLPELPSARAHRGPLPPQPRGLPMQPQQVSHHSRAMSHPELPHSYSAPSAVPHSRQDQYADPQARTSRSRRYDEPPGWDGPQTHDDSRHRSSLQPTVEDELGELPPLPPSHRNSTPRLRGPPARSHSVDDYSPSPIPHGIDFRKSYSGPVPPASNAPSSTPSSPAYSRPSSSHQRLPARHSMTEPYNTGIPSRAHPLAQEMRHSATYANDPSLDEPYNQAYASDAASMVKPRAISPAPRARNSLASMRHPIQSFVSQQNSPSGGAPDVPSLPSRSVPSRKSVSPRPSTASSIPFSPDDYSSFNPNASTVSPYTHAQTTNPHSPYHIPNQTRAGSEEPQSGARPLPNPDGPITTWDGRTIDPSDHLPVQSWAPEPEKKSPKGEKIYGAGSYDPSRPRGMSGPRHNVPAGGGRVGRDVVVNIRTKHSANPHSNPNSPSVYDPPSPSPGSRHRLQKRSMNGMPRSPNPHDGGVSPLSEIDVPNPYGAGQRYSEGFSDGRPGVGEAMQSRYQSRSPAPPHSQYRQDPYQQQQLQQYQDPYQQQQQYPQQQQRHYGDLFGGNYGEGEYADGGYDGRGYDGRPGGHQGGYSEPPDVPPKVAFSDHAYGASALEKELQRIDIGGSSSGGSGRRPTSRGTGGGGPFRGRDSRYG